MKSFESLEKVFESLEKVFESLESLWKSLKVSERLWKTLKVSESLLMNLTVMHSKRVFSLVFYIDTQSMYLFSNIDLGNTTYRKRAKTFIEFYNEKQTIKINNIDIHKSDKKKMAIIVSLLHKIPKVMEFLYCVWNYKNVPFCNEKGCHWSFLFILRGESHKNVFLYRS